MSIWYASYGHRYSDPLGTVMGRNSLEVEEALNSAIEQEIEDLKGYCDREHDADDPEDECSLCNPDVVSYGVWPLLPSDVKEIGRQKILDGFREIRGTESKTFHLSQD